MQTSVYTEFKHNEIAFMQPWNYQLLDQRIDLCVEFLISELFCSYYVYDSWS